MGGGKRGHRAGEQREDTPGREDTRPAPPALADGSPARRGGDQPAPEAIQGSGDLLEQAFASIHFMLAHMDTRFNFIRVNRAYAEADEREPEFYVGRNHFALYPNPEYEAVFRRVVATGAPHFAIEAPFEYPDHPERGVTWWDRSLHPLRAPDGTVNGLMLCLVDATERKRAREALRESEERLRAILSSLHETFITVHDRQGVPVAIWITPELEQRYGRQGYEFLSRPLGELLPPDLARQQGDNIEKTFRAGRSHREDLPLVLPKGQFWFDLAASPMRDAAGEVSAVVAVFRDIQHRKNAERALRAAHRRLLVAREQQRRHVARELHDSVGQALIGLKMLFRGLLDDQGVALPERAREALDKGVARCARLIDEVRGICHGLFPPTLEPLGLAAALAQMAQDIPPEVSVSLEIPPHLQPARFPDQVELALFRIAQEAFANALRHGKAKSIVLSLHQCQEQLVLRVTDNGAGFDPAAGNGVRGLGLSSMHHRAEDLGGRLEIASRPGCTVVTARVPSGQQPPPPPVPAMGL